MNWHFIGLESEAKKALFDCFGTLTSGDGDGYGLFWGDGLGDCIHWDDDERGLPGDDYGDGYDYGNGDGDGANN
jgi:hypothetical protein